MTRPPWAVRFAVRLRPVTGDPVTYTVLTWLHEHKAVVLAAVAFHRQWPD